MVVGANGVIGRNLIDHLITLPDWDVIGVSRRSGESVGRVRYVAADLLNIDDTREKLNSLTEVTHIFYAAYQDRPTWAELVPPNLAMLVNTVETIEPIAPGLKHVSLMQGYKVYGAHLGPFKTPARETDANHMPPEFNIDQQDFLEQRQKGKAWTWSALRPSVVCGFSLGNPMNLAMVIAIYASISKELGIPLRFPGKPGEGDGRCRWNDLPIQCLADHEGLGDSAAALAPAHGFRHGSGTIHRTGSTHCLCPLPGTEVPPAARSRPPSVRRSRIRCDDGVRRRRRHGHSEPIRVPPARHHLGVLTGTR